MDKYKIIDKLTFYWGFLDTFIKDTERVLKTDTYHHLKILREWIIEAIAELRKDD